MVKHNEAPSEQLPIKYVSTCWSPKIEQTKYDIDSQFGIFGTSLKLAGLQQQNPFGPDALFSTDFISVRKNSTICPFWENS